jgi:hypothetical protein
VWVPLVGDDRKPHARSVRSRARSVGYQVVTFL